MIFFKPLDLYVDNQKGTLVTNSNSFLKQKKPAKKAGNKMEKIVKNISSIFIINLNTY